MNDLQAIPTEFNGTLYRSRLEADTARLLTLLTIPFEYEAKSYLLPSGIHFWPDFLLHGRTQALEVRGYENAKGDRQLREFAQFVASHGLGRYETFFGVLSARPLVESVLSIQWDTGEHGVHFSPQWAFTAGPNDDSTWAMSHTGLYQQRHTEGWPDERVRRLYPVVIDGVLSFERWINEPPYECDPVRVRDIPDAGFLRGLAV